MKIFVAESVSAEDFYNRHWEGHVVQEIVHLLGERASYRIVINESLLRKAIKFASEYKYDIFHLSCHGNEDGIQLSDKRNISWERLAGCFQNVAHLPTALVLSSCIGGDRGIAHAFAKHKKRPRVIFGAEASEEEHLLTFPGACISWPILYTALATDGMTVHVFKNALDKMNQITSHRFVYRRWLYVRYPGPPKSG